MPSLSLSKYHGLFGKPTKFFLKGRIMFLSAKLNHSPLKEKTETTKASFKAVLLTDKHTQTHTHEMFFKNSPKVNYTCFGQKENRTRD